MFRKQAVSTDVWYNFYQKFNITLMCIQGKSYKYNVHSKWDHKTIEYFHGSLPRHWVEAVLLSIISNSSVITIGVS